MSSQQTLQHSPETPGTKTKVYLVDGSGYIFRAFYATPPLTNSKKFPTNALYGFTRMLLRLLSLAASEHLAVIFDAGKKTFRNDLYQDYKANRKECPPELAQQFPYFREISRALGLPVFEMSNYEADDLIGTLAKRTSAAGVETVIVSGDKDLLQLVGEKVSVWDTMKDQRFGPAEVKEKLGVWPNQVVELLGLTGDSSDNIPGLKGAGPKTALSLIERFGTVENIIKSSELIKNDASIRNRQKIAAQIELDTEILRLSRRLVEIDTNVPLNLEELAHNGHSQAGAIGSLEALLACLCRISPNREQMQKLFNELEFGTLLKEFELVSAQHSGAVSDDYKVTAILKKDFGSWLAEFNQQNFYAFDLETTSLDVQKAEIVGVSFCWSEKEAFYLPIAHTESPEVQISLQDFMQACTASLTNPAVKKCGQNLKYDYGVLAEHGIYVGGISFDSMLASYLLSPDKGSHDLTTLAHDYLGRNVIEYDQVTEGKANFKEVSIQSATKYSGDDALNAFLLHAELRPKLEAEELSKLFTEIEMPLIPILSAMERAGIKLDLEILRELSRQFETELGILSKEIFQHVGFEFNLNSPKQLADVLFDKLAIPTKGLKRTKTGISTDSGVLERISDYHPVPKLILKYRLIFKLKSTYVDALAQQVSTKTGRLHTRFNQTVTGTGRLSSSDPNLQNIPIQTEQGRSIRKAFVAGADKILISADYSQIELRILAHLSGDPTMIDGFKRDLDVHTLTARELLGIGPIETVTPEMRRIGKTINFGIIYGMGSFRLARELGLPLKVAAEYIENYFNRYSKVKAYFARLEEEIQNNGYVCTLFGRRRYAAALEGMSRDKGFALRAAINAPLQGTAADLVKLAMIKITKTIEDRALPLKLLLQIHDELLFEADRGFAEEALPIIKSEMENVYTLDVPLKVDTGVGLSWYEAHA